MIEAYIAGIGLLGPGLPNWAAGRQILDGSLPYDPTEVVPPAPEGLSPRERRRTSAAVRLALAVAQEAVDNAQDDPKLLPMVFGWPHGDGPVVQRLLEALATRERHVSPTDFHNSVHNVAVGYWAIASGSHQPCSSIAAAADTFPASLLKALAQVQCEARRVLFVVCGVPFTEPLNRVRPLGAPFGVAFDLAPVHEARSVARISATYEPNRPTAVSEPLTPELRTLWVTNPAVRAVPLLEHIARKNDAQIQIPYGPHGHLALSVSPC